MRQLTPRIALELIAHEGLVREAYRDSGGVWTWSVGITDASGHRVFPRYKDAPQPLAHCLGVYLWLLATRYLPPVLAAFGAHEPGEAELGAALSFHWNTGAIGRASWLRRLLAGDAAGARAGLLDWARPAALLPRRQREAALLCDGRWSGDGTALVYDVAKPAYRPCGGTRQRIDGVIAELFAAPEAWRAGEPAGAPAPPAPATPSPAAPRAAPSPGA